MYACFTYSLFLWPLLLACGLLVPHQGWNPGPISESTESWTTSKVPLLFLKNQEEASDIADVESTVYQRSVFSGEKEKEPEIKVECPVGFNQADPPSLFFSHKIAEPSSAVCFLR